MKVTSPTIKRARSPSSEILTNDLGTVSSEGSARLGNSESVKRDARSDDGEGRLSGERRDDVTVWDVP